MPLLQVSISSVLQWQLPQQQLGLWQLPRLLIPLQLPVSVFLFQPLLLLRLLLPLHPTYLTVLFRLFPFLLMPII